MGVWDKLDDPMSFRTRGGSPVSELGILEVVSGTWAVLGNAERGNIWISGRRKHEKTPTPVAVAVETKPSHNLPRLDDPTTRDRMTCHFGER